MHQAALRQAAPGDVACGGGFDNGAGAGAQALTLIGVAQLVDGCRDVKSCVVLRGLHQRLRQRKGLAAYLFFAVFHNHLVHPRVHRGGETAERHRATGLRLHGKGCLFQDMGEGQRAARATRVQLTNGGEPGPQALLEPRQVVD